MLPEQSWSSSSMSGKLVHELCFDTFVQGQNSCAKTPA